MFTDAASGRLCVFPEISEAVMCCCLSKNGPARDLKRVLQSSRGRALVSLTAGLSVRMLVFPSRPGDLSYQHEEGVGVSTP